MVQLGQAYDVVDEGQKTIGIMVDLRRYVGNRSPLTMPVSISSE